MSCTLQSMKMPPEVGAKRTKNPLGSFWSQVCERTRKGRPIPPAAMFLRVCVARVEAAHEADHRDAIGVRARRAFNALAVFHAERQRFFAEHVLAGLERGDGLIGVQCGRRDQHHGVDVGVAHESVEVGMQARDAELASCHVEFGGHRRARRHELATAHAKRQVLGMAAAEPAETGDADAKGEVASSNVLDSGSKFTGWPLAPRRGRRIGQFERLDTVFDRRAHAPPDCQRSKKCAISSAYAAR